MNNALVRKIFYPVNEALRHRQTFRFLREMHALDKLSWAQVQARQFEKLQRILAHAYRHVPYYRYIMQEQGFIPERMQAPSDLAKLPILTKAELRTYQRDLISPTHRRLIRNCTSGSSGQPLQFYSDSCREAALNAAKWRGRYWWGHRIGDREVCVWGWAGIETNTWYRALVRRKDYLLNYFFLDSMRLDQARLSETCRKIAKHQPHALYGFPSSLAAVAQYLRETKNGCSWRIKPRVVITTGETLYPHQQEIISEVFQCGIAREYGSHDGGIIAFDCPSGGFHVMADHVYIESLPEAPGAKPGNLLVTNLDGYGMPFIRYKIGDTGQLDDRLCSCGLPLPLLRNFDGRKLESITLPDGTQINGLYFTGLLRDYASIRAFKVLQHADYSIIVFVIPAASFTSAHKRELEKKFSAFLQQQVSVRIETVEALPFTQVGKLLLVESEVLKAPAADTHLKSEKRLAPQHLAIDERSVRYPQPALSP